jgi:hypothetical protein
MAATDPNQMMLTTCTRCAIKWRVCWAGDVALDDFLCPNCDEHYWREQPEIEHLVLRQTATSGAGAGRE